MKELPEEVIYPQLRRYYGPSKLREIVERCKEISKMEQRYMNESRIERSDSDGNKEFIGCVDSHVNFKIHIAIECYKINAFRSSIVFLGAAVEEEITRLYEAIEKAQIPKDWRWRNLRDWADTQSSLTGNERTGLISLMMARNFHAHAHRIMRDKTDKSIKGGKLDGVLPDNVDYPGFYKELAKYWEKSTGTKIDLMEPKVGWLGTKECALKATELVVDFVCRTSKDHVSEAVKEILSKPPSWEEDDE